MNRVTILIIIFLWLSYHSFAQEREIIPLNEHFYPLALGFGQHTYNDVKTVSPEGEIIEKIFTLDNRLVQNRKTNLGESSIERMQTSKYGEDGELLSIEIFEFENGIEFTQVLNQSRLVLELACAGEICEGEFYGSYVNKNVLKPSPRSIESWKHFLNRELTYPLVARRIGAQGDVLLGLKINFNGKLVEKVVINPNEVHKSLVKEALRVVDSYTDYFDPALDLQGDPIEAWLYMPVKFQLGGKKL